MKDEGPMGRKLLLYGKKPLDASRVDGTLRIRVGELRASSRGNTKDPSVIRIYWV